MYQSTLLLLLSLLSLHLTNKCLAQEPTTTITPVEATTTTPTSEFIVIHPTTINTFVDTNSATTTFVIPEDSTTLLEPPSDPTTTTAPTTGLESITDSTSNSNTSLPSETSILPPIPTIEFTASANHNVVRDCDELTVSWTGMGIEAPYWITYSTGTGDLGDASILGKETSLGWVCEDYLRWQAPPISKIPHGNSIRFTIEEKYGQVATVWVAWESADFQECPPFSRGEPDKHCLPSAFSIHPLAPVEEITSFFTANIADHTDNDNGLIHPSTIITASTTQMVTLTLTVPAGPNADSPAAMPVPPEMVTLTLTVPAGSTPTPAPRPTPPPLSSINTTPNPVTVAVAEPSVVAVPIEGNNSPSPPRNNNLRPSGIIGPPLNSPSLNSPQPSGSSGSNSQGSNPDSDIHVNQFLRTFVVPLGDSTTLTIITEIPHPTESTRDNVGVQQSSNPATTAANGQKNDNKRTGLPPAVTGIIVGTILCGLTLWILLLIWLKRRKRAARGFNELEDPVSFAPAEEIKVTPYISPARAPSSLNTNTNPNPKRIIQEIIRSDSPVTSIGDTSAYSGLYNLPISDTQSQEPSCSVASSKPLSGQAKLYKSPRGSMI